MCAYGFDLLVYAMGLNGHGFGYSPDLLLFGIKSEAMPAGWV